MQCTSVYEQQVEADGQDAASKGMYVVITGGDNVVIGGNDVADDGDVAVKVGGVVVPPGGPVRSVQHQPVC